MGRKWFRLLGDEIDLVDVLELDADALCVVDFQEAVFKCVQHRLPLFVIAYELVIFRNHKALDANDKLASGDAIASMGTTFEDPLVVRVPFAPVMLRPFVETTPRCLPVIKTLPNVSELTAECAAIAQWRSGQVYQILHIHEFMKPLGGCLQDGRLFWREEEKQLLTILLEQYNPAPTNNKLHNWLAARRCLVMGSPGVGKSTMLCLTALYSALVHSANVLVVRRVMDVDHEYCLFFVGHKAGRVVLFSMTDCQLEDAIVVNTMLQDHPTFPSVRLMLDDFVYRQLPEGLSNPTHLTTNVHPHPRSSEIAYNHICLYPSWRREDLFHVGRMAFGWDDETMTRRFFLSGGSVREFTLADANEIAAHMNWLAYRRAGADFLRLLAWWGWGPNDTDGLRRSFVEKDKVDDPFAYSGSKWDSQAVDSEYVVGVAYEVLRMKGIDVSAQQEEEIRRAMARCHDT